MIKIAPAALTALIGSADAAAATVFGIAVHVVENKTARVREMKLTAPTGSVFSAEKSIASRIVVIGVTIKTAPDI